MERIVGNEQEGSACNLCCYLTFGSLSMTWRRAGRPKKTEGRAGRGREIEGKQFKYGDRGRAAGNTGSLCGRILRVQPLLEMRLCIESVVCL